MKFILRHSQIKELSDKSPSEIRSIMRNLEIREPLIMWLRLALLIFAFGIPSILDLLSLNYFWLLELPLIIMSVFLYWGFVINPRIERTLKNTKNAAEQGAAANP